MTFRNCLYYAMESYVTYTKSLNLGTSPKTYGIYIQQKRRKRKKKK